MMMTIVIIIVIIIAFDLKSHTLAFSRATPCLTRPMWTWPQMASTWAGQCSQQPLAFQDVPNGLGVFLFVEGTILKIGSKGKRNLPLKSTTFQLFG